jgi:hypothetical protein
VIGVISRLDEEFLQLKNNIKNNQIKKSTRDLNRHFSKEDTQIL